MTAALGNIHHDRATLAEIRHAVQAGREVVTHTESVSVPGWGGAGYLILDPETGGGENGAFIAVGSIHGTALGYTLFYSSVAFMAKGVPYGVVGLPLVVEENAIGIATFNYYSYVYGPDEAACYLAGVGIGPIAAGVAGQLIADLANVSSASSIVAYIQYLIRIALAMQDVTAVPRCL